MRSHIPVFVAALTSLLWATGASAATVEYTFSANVSLEIRGNQLATPEQTFFAPGTLIAGSFDYDPTAPLLLADSGGSIYGSVSNLTGSIDGRTFSDPSGFSFVSNNRFDLDPNDPNNPLIDFLSIAADGGPDATLDGFAIDNQGSQFDLVNVRLFWFSPQGDFLSDESLPNMPAPQTEIARMALDFVDLANPSITHTVFAEPLVVTPVPVPAAAWLLISALGVFRIFAKPRQPA
ncbi:MAG: hypothetical protein AB8G16_15075 [Gammaproteobacteria bacterium]